MKSFVKYQFVENIPDHNQNGPKIPGRRLVLIVPFLLILFCCKAVPLNAAEKNPTEPSLQVPQNTAQADKPQAAKPPKKTKAVAPAEGTAKTKGFTQRLWEYEVWKIDDNAVTIKKLVFAIVILIFGILITKKVIRLLSKRLFYFKQVKESTASAVEKLLSYFAYILILLFALRIVNIPLTAFAFLGGAIAIGVGFGAQNLLNNFISGFLMMAERPISIGDLIELEGIVGKVEEIGARCTRIRTGENVHILVPNSSFLEKNIINWTLSDHRIRAKVTVGVAYGSPVKEVERLLLKAVAEEDEILSDPAPFVIFNDFGDDALIFNVHFWIVINQAIERRRIESHVRYRIDDLFGSAGIIIAFPQRDVHLDSQGPLEIKVVDKKG